MSADICDTSHRGKTLLPLSTAIQQLIEAAQPLTTEAEAIPLAHALGSTLAEPVQMSRAEPPTRRSAMDGWAVRSDEGMADRLVCGAVYAGTSEIPEVQSGQTVAVMTGGVVPDGADTVIPVEYTNRIGDTVSFSQEPQAGRHVRQTGEMGEEGRVLLEPGRVLTSADLSAAAGCGADPIWVAARPRAIVMATGDEVVPWASDPEPHQVRDSNRLGSIAQLIAAGADVIEHMHVPDDPDALRSAVENALTRCDLLVTIGGVSMGDKDHLPSTFESCGVTKLFHGVSVQPGKPAWAGHIDSTFVLGLPGNPVSSFVILEAFAVPLLQRMMGGKAQMRPYLKGTLGAPARAKKRERFLPADLSINESGQLVITPRPEQGSGDWTSLAGADALLHIPAGSTLAAGDDGECFPITGWR